MAAPPPSKLDHNQILPAAFDDNTGTLRTSATLVASGSSEIIVTHTDDSIRLGDGNNLITATQVNSKTGLDVSIISGGVTGELSVTGLSKDLKTQSITVGAVPVKIPATPLTDRNTMSVRVYSNSTVFFGDSSVTVSNGYPKYYKEEIVLDIRDNSAVELYAVCDTGVTAELRILELA
jgi:hypothetical protein